MRPGWCAAGIQQFAVIGLSRAQHSEAWLVRGGDPAVCFHRVEAVHSIQRPGERAAGIQQFALIGSLCSLHYEAWPHPRFPLPPLPLRFCCCCCSPLLPPPPLLPLPPLPLRLLLIVLLSVLPLLSFLSLLSLFVFCLCTVVVCMTVFWFMLTALAK